MKGERQVTAGTFQDVTAVAAENIGGAATPVEEQDGLLFMLQRLQSANPAAHG